MEKSKFTKRKPIFVALNRKLIIMLVILTFGFFVSQVYVTSQVGTKSAEIEDIRRQKDTLRLENEIISSKIDEAKSLENIKNVAEKYGLTEKHLQEVRIQNPSSDLAAL